MVRDQFPCLLALLWILTFGPHTVQGQTGHWCTNTLDRVHTIVETCGNYFRNTILEKPHPYVLDTEASGIGNLSATELEQFILASIADPSIANCTFVKKWEEDVDACCGGWGGENCTEVECDPSCINGDCVENEDGGSKCICDEGYIGAACGEEAPSYTCHHYTQAEQDRTAGGESEKAVCESENNRNFTAGDNDNFRGCGNCWCCEENNPDLQYCYEKNACNGLLKEGIQFQKVDFNTCCADGAGSWGRHGHQCDKCPENGEEPGVYSYNCMNYGRIYYRTFDGKVILMNGNCTYLLAAVSNYDWYIRIHPVHCEPAQNFNNCTKHIFLHSHGSEAKIEGRRIFRQSA